MDVSSTWRNSFIVTPCRNTATTIADSQEAEMFRTFAGLVLSGKCDGYWPEITLKTQRVLDAALKSANNGGNPIAP